MIKNPWFIVFLLVVAGDLAGIFLENEWLQYICKPMIVPAVAVSFLTRAGGQLKGLKMRILWALFFSWAGDILLMFDAENEMFFLLGLSSFLIAHLFYISFFSALRVREKIKSNHWFLLIVAIYYTSLIVFLAEYLGDKEWPVRIYGIVISFMLLLALNMRSLTNRRASGLMITGAVLFVISDSLLAINKFYQSFEGAGLLVIATYAFAQWFIAEGAAQYLRAAPPKDLNL